MSGKPEGRSRGRARGRSRGQAASEPVRRPGEEAKSQAQQSQHSIVGRAVHRGTGREARPGDQGAEGGLARDVAALRIGGDSTGVAGRGARRRGAEIYEPTTRPPNLKDKRGSSGKKVELYANYFRLVSLPNWRIYQYHVDFSPIVESSRLRRGLLFNHKELLGSCFLFDGMSDLKSLQKLELEVTEVYSKRQTDNENIRITIKRVAELAPSHPEVNRLFNTVMRRNLQHLEFQQLGRHYFDKHDVSSIKNFGIELWKGVSTAIQEHESGVLMVVDTIHKVLHEDTVLDRMSAISRETGGRNFQDVCTKELAGQIVMTRYNNRTYKIEDIDWEQNPAYTFEQRDEKITLIDYYKKQYDIIIRDVDQPLLVCKSKQRELRTMKSKNIYLIPELCCMTGITDSMRADYKLMKDLSSHTRLDPEKRVNNLLSFIRRVNSNDRILKEMSGWGIKFADELVTLEGRVVQPERILHRGDKSTYNADTADFSREMRGKAMFKSINLHKWVVLTPNRERPKAEDFIQNLSRVCPPMGMQVAAPEIVVLPDDRTNSYINAMRSVLSPELQIIIAIVPNDRKERYDAIKKLGCIDFPIPTQVIVARTLAKRQMLMSVATKIGIQLNCKLGGEAWAVEIPLTTPLMVIGFDSYHDSSRKGQSVGGFVASLNNSLTRWYSQVNFHQKGGWQELSNSLSVHMANALKRYYKVNNKLPQMILFYRDGVSEGQIRHVVEYELIQIQEVLSKTAEGQFRFSFIIVSKRISTRFFARTGRESTNPLPGTVVDCEVTRPSRYDFFLVSQSVRQGTVTPTHYNVISDNSGLSPEHIQRLTYKLTHLYFNWPGTIRVPAPCQYAHKLAFLTGQSLHREPGERLAETLFYL